MLSHKVGHSCITFWVHTLSGDRLFCLRSTIAESTFSLLELLFLIETFFVIRHTSGSLPDVSSASDMDSINSPNSTFVMLAEKVDKKFL